MATQRVQFENAVGETLTGDLVLPPDGRARAYALFAHCFTCGRNVRASRDLSHALAQQGIGVLRFDFTGLGASDGEFADTSFVTNLDDLIAAADYLAREHEAPQLLVGHSLGGAAVIHAADRIPSATAIATIGAPADPSHVAHLLEHARDEIEATGSAEIELGGRAIRIGKRFLDDLVATGWRDRIHDLRRALLILHSPVDEIVGIDNAAAVFQEALHPKSFVSLDDADHLLTRSQDSQYAGAVIAAWAHRYLDLEPVAEPPDAAGFPVAVRIGESGFLSEIRAADHGLVADEPEAVGGTDRGPSPYDLLLASLGACTAMTLRMYADHKGLPLDGVTVRLAHDRIHAEDCAARETETGRIDRIRREIELEGSLDDAQRKRLLEIADRCPVHRTLHSEILNETTLVS
jgi:uncharacterized OsmC-like protein/alpha/beta superfamily hydrolase